MLRLSVMPGRFSVCRLDVSSDIPHWEIQGSAFFSITKTREELSIVCLEDKVPSHVKAEKSWKGWVKRGI